MRAIIANDTTADRHHGSSAVMTALVSGLESRGLRVVGRLPVGHRADADPGMAARLAGADLIVANGEGTLHSNRPAALALLDLLARGRAAGLRTALVNFTWDRMDPVHAAALTACAPLVAREGRSAEALSRLGIAAEVIADLSLTTPPPPRAARRSGIVWNCSVIGDLAMALHARARAEGWRHLPIFLGEPAGRVRRLHAARRDMALRPRRYLLARRMDREIATQAVSDTRAFLAALAAAEGCVTGRFHGMCLAAVARTPFLAVASNTFKIAAMVEDLGLDPARVLSPEAVSRHPAPLLPPPWSVAETAALDRALPEIRHRWDAVFDRLGAGS